MNTLSKRENLISRLKGQKTQKVPWVPFVGVHAAKVLGVALEDFLYDSDLIARGVIEAARLYNADGIPLCFDLQIEAELLGAKTKCLPKMPPSIIKHPLANATIADLPSYEPNSGRLKKVLDAIAPIRQGLGEDVALYALVCGVLTLAYQLRGSQLIEDMKNPESLRELLAFCKDTQIKTINAYAQRGVDVVAVVEPMCSNMQKEFFCEELFALENELFDCINRAGLVSSFFLCGDVNALLGEICKTNCHNICVCSNVSLAVLKGYALAANKSFGGNLNPRNAILNASKEDCVAYAKKCLDIGDNTAYILSSGCDLPFDCPSENLIAISQMNMLKS